MISLSHPNILDKIALKIYPGYLYSGQLCQSVAFVNAGILHKLPDIKPFWKIMDYIYLKKDSSMKYLGLARNLDIVGDVEPAYNIFEIISPVFDESKSFGKRLFKGDLICLSPFDRQFIVSTPEISK